MSAEFEPAFKHFQRDVERYLTHTGKRENRKDGTVVFRGYDDALRRLFDLYIRNRSYQPLVEHFRKWNWEHSYNDYLLELTAELKRSRDWANLRILWEKGVIRSRKKLYNDMRKIESESPGYLKQDSVQQATKLLLEALTDVEKLASELGTPSDVDDFVSMKSKVLEGKKLK